MGKVEADYCGRYSVKGEDTTVTSCNMGNSDWEQDKNLSPIRVVKHESIIQKSLWNLSLEIFKIQKTKSPLI